MRGRGDAALLEYTERFDRVRVPEASALELPREALQRALEDLPAPRRDALAAAAHRIRDFHQRQRAESWSYTTPDGTRLGQKVTPLDRVGLYVPGGKAAYPSSVLMNAIPAKVAGVTELVMVTPTPDGIRNPLVLAAACDRGRGPRVHGGRRAGHRRAGVGHRDVPAVDKIVGPGNAYVAQAKRRVFGVVGIDMLAGPSEILVISDASTPVDWVAMDLFSQAEHDELAQAILLCPDADYLDAVQAAIVRLLPSMPRRDVIARSLADRGALIRVRDLEQACAITDRIAPEHLEIVDRAIRSAGPTGSGTPARCSSVPGRRSRWATTAPGPTTCCRRCAPRASPRRWASTTSRSDRASSRCRPRARARSGAIAAELAHGEGLQAHARSAEMRMEPP